MQLMFKDYEMYANEAAAIILCNHSALNMAIEMDFGNEKPDEIIDDVNNVNYNDRQVTKKELQVLKGIVGHLIENDSDKNLKLRVKLISMFVDLMVYDLKGEKDGVTTDDFKDCLEEFLSSNYNVEDDE